MTRESSAARRARRTAPRLFAVGLAAVALGITAPGAVADPASGPHQAAAGYRPYAGTMAAAAPIGTTTESTIVTPDGRVRHYRVYVPRALPSGPVPLLVGLHGGLGNAAQFEANSGFDGLAESNGFIVVYPDGVGGVLGRDDLETWNGGTCCGPAARDGIDDIAFLRSLVTTLLGTQPIDPHRVFLVGHSNGGILAYRAACELADVVVAIAVQAGALAVSTCTPVPPVAVFHLHGLSDTNVPVDGGRGSGPSGFVFPPARNSVAVLSTGDRCPTVPTTLHDRRNPDLTVTTWSPCAAGTEVRFVTVRTASHAWMGHDATSPVATSLVGVPYPRLDASRAMWSFLAEHPRP